jgi:glutathione peroxidase
MKMTWMIAVLVAAAAVALVSLWAGRAFSSDMTRASGQSTASLYDLDAESLDGQAVDLDQYRGKVALVVNTASKCGLTPQYEGLEKLYRELADQDFVVLGFPSGDFMGQEYGEAAEIREFCSVNYGVTFPLFAKSHVKGKDRSEVFRLLTEELEEPTWNFTKYVVGRDGRVVARFGPRTAPDNPRLRDTIERALAAE